MNYELKQSKMKENFRHKIHVIWRRKQLKSVEIECVIQDSRSIMSILSTQSLHDSITGSRVSIICRFVSVQVDFNTYEVSKFAGCRS